MIHRGGSAAREALRRIAALGVVLGILSCGGHPSGEQKQETLERADEALLAGRLDEAEEIFGSVSRSDPSDPRARAGLGLAYLRSGRPEEALAEFEAALKIDPSSTHYGYLRGRTLSELGRVDGAIAAFDAVLERDPSHVDAARGLIDLLMAAQRKREAADVARVMAQRSPHDFGLLMDLGRVLEAAGAPHDAYACYRRAREIRPYRVDAVYAMISALQAMNRTAEAAALIPLHEELKRRAEAVEKLRIAAAANPGDGAAAKTYLQRLFEEGWLDVAVRETAIFLGQFEDDPEGKAIAVRAAQAALLIGDRERAGELAMAALGLGRLGPEEKLAVAGVLNALGQFDAAGVLFAERLEENPDDAVSLAGLGLGHVASGRLEKAQESLSRALELNPGLAGAHAAMGLLRIKQLDDEAARRSFERALEVDPRQADALFGMGLLAHQRGDLPQAEGYLRRALELRPSDVSILSSLALVLSDQQRCDEAIPLFTEALRTDYSNMTLQTGLVHCYEQTGRTGEAEAARKRAEDLLGTAP